jgi:RHS repeat-associated protein
VTITGSGFVAGATSVSFGGTPASAVRVISSSSVQAVAPAGTGTVDVTVNAPGGQSATATSDRYVYQSAVSGYAYNGDGLRISETTAAGTQHFAWDATPAVPEVISDGTDSYIYGPQNLPIEQVDGSGTPTYFFHDANGSTRALLNAAGGIASTFRYTAYGALAGVSGTGQTPLLYGGSYLDRDTGLYYLVHRYYDPAAGQFTTIDPELDTTHQAYEYAGDDPVNASDPSGLCSWYNVYCEAKAHITGTAQVIIAVAAAAPAVACVIAAPCGVAVAVGLGVVFGAAGGAESYGIGGGSHSGLGYAVYGVIGAITGGLGPVAKVPIAVQIALNAIGNFVSMVGDAGDTYSASGGAAPTSSGSRSSGSSSHGAAHAC